MTSAAPPGRDVGPSADRRVLSLLDGYLALAGGSLAPLDTDLFQLSVPAGDEARFGGRSVVRVAFSVDALELDDRAEMAIVGSPFVGQLIDAIRYRGSRVFAGWVVPRMFDTTATPGLPVPFPTGTAGEGQSWLARHRVGRLTARVAVRAGTELRERLADSALYDLCSGIPLPNDLSAACQDAAPPEAVSEHWRSIESVPPQQTSALIERMLGDLEHALRPEIEEVGANATRSLNQELQRIERYYTALLNQTGGRGTELPDAGSRGTITAEHQRRAAEERDRHAVRAVVHPIQMTEWEIVVQRATWRLSTPSGHFAFFTAQRALAGAGAWSHGCESCGNAAPHELAVCIHDHVACDTCADSCGVCGEDFCRRHGIGGCHVDGQPVCERHARTCRICRRPHCSMHEGMCDDGAHAACSTCLGPCAMCGRVICNAHAFVSKPDAPKGSRRFCYNCARTCEGGTGEVVGPDEVTGCASCERVVCERHQARCAVDGKVHCSRHLRRTDRSRRLVCERDRATCSHEPNAVFAGDEVSACATCGRVNCDQHLAECVADRQRHCVSHLAAVADKPGAYACEVHRSTCHVDGGQFTLDGTHACPCCGKLACARHTRECANCRRQVCTQDYSAINPRVCATCMQLEPSADPDDEILAAAVELRGADSSGAKSWRIARDARHSLVEMELGWTRRVVMVVPHGESRAERAVAHSALGTRVLR